MKNVVITDYSFDDLSIEKEIFDKGFWEGCNISIIIFMIRYIEIKIKKYSIDRPKCRRRHIIEIKK